MEKLKLNTAARAGANFGFETGIGYAINVLKWTAEDSAEKDPEFARAAATLAETLVDMKDRAKLDLIDHVNFDISFDDDGSMVIQ